MTLKEARLWRGLTQEELAERSGVDQTTISRLELDNDPDPRHRTVEKLAAGLNIPLTRLRFLSTPENETVGHE